MTKESNFYYRCKRGQEWSVQIPPDLKPLWWRWFSRQCPQNDHPTICTNKTKLVEKLQCRGHHIGKLIWNRSLLSFLAAVCKKITLNLNFHAKSKNRQKSKVIVGLFPKRLLPNPMFWKTFNLMYIACMIYKQAYGVNEWTLENCKLESVWAGEKARSNLIE